MSKFKVFELPGGEITIGRELISDVDGVDDWTPFLLRYEDQETLIRWLLENREGLIDKLRKSVCAECGRPLDLRGKCHECLNNQFLDNEYDAAYGKDGE